MSASRPYPVFQLKGETAQRRCAPLTWKTGYGDVSARDVWVGARGYAHHGRQILAQTRRGGSSRSGETEWVIGGR
ncbi:MAG: hypothetical protein ACJA0K_002065 [Maricaulis maris]